MENETMPSVAQTEEESTDLDTVEDVVESGETTDESVDELKEKLAKAEQLAENQKIRAEKAEKKAKEKVETKAPAEVETTEGLSSKDTIAIINAKVHEEDVDEVASYARYKGISVAEALKSSILRATLAEKEEHRKTANATSTGKTRGGASKATGDTLLEKAQKTGELPSTDEELRALAQARLKK